MDVFPEGHVHAGGGTSGRRCRQRWHGPPKIPPGDGLPQSRRPEARPPDIRSGTEDGSEAAPVETGAWPRWRALPRPQRSRVGGCAGYFGLLTLLFLQQLTRLMLYAAQSDLHSHILLVPLIAGYLLYIQRGRLSSAYRSSIAGTVTAGRGGRG